MSSSFVHSLETGEYFDWQKQQEEAEALRRQRAKEAQELASRNAFNEQARTRNLNDPYAAGPHTSMVQRWFGPGGVNRKRSRKQRSRRRQRSYRK